MEGLKNLKITPVKSLIVALSTIALVGTVMFRSQFANFSTLAGLQDGANICFSRVVQSFTAKMLGENGSQYLTKDFQALTEECYGDLAANGEEIFKSDYHILGADINALASDVHWFHEKLDVTVIDLTGNAASPVLVQNRFRKLESANDSVGQSLEEAKVQLKESFTQYGIGLVSAIILIIGLAAYEWRRSVKVAGRRKAIESKAASAVQSGIVESGRAEVIIRDALECYELVKCVELFSHYREGATGSFVQKAHNADEVAERKEKRQNELQGNRFRLVTVMDQVVNRLKDQIYAHGILVNIDIEDDLLIRAEAEEVIQLLFESVAHAIKKSVKSVGRARVNISARPLGGTIICSVDCNGGVYTHEAMKAIKQAVPPTGLGSSLQIVSELAREVDGKVQLENLKAGSRLKLVLKRARSLVESQDAEEMDVDQGIISADAKEVRSVVRGTKKEVMAQIANS